MYGRKEFPEGFDEDGPEVLNGRSMNGRHLIIVSMVSAVVVGLYD